jgi:RNA binding exosome subunit
VLAACKHVLPQAYADAIVFTRSDLVGHYGNPITLVNARISDPTRIAAFIDGLARGLSDVDKDALSSEVNRHLDEKGALYLRLDKQDAFDGKIRLGRSDSIRVQIKLRARRHVDDAMTFYRSLDLL